jgi:hypothetical protein
VNLRHKFGILALIYVLSLCANLVMSGWCIVAYFQTAFVDVRSSFVRQAEIERLRVRLQGARERMRLYGDALAPARWQQEIQGLITAGALPAPDGSGASWDAALEQSLAQALADPSEDALERCDHELGKISTAITRGARRPSTTPLRPSRKWYRSSLGIPYSGRCFVWWA